MRVSVAGQAKHYGRNRKIGPDLIRELSGSMSNGRWAFGVITTTASFTSGARRIAGRKRIDCNDGEPTAFKVMENELGLVENNDIRFDEQVFAEWLHRR